MKARSSFFGRSAICACVLLLFAGISSPLGLGIATLVGLTDRTHMVGLQAGEQGAQLVLHHGSDYLTHRHGMAARLLTLFAQPRQTGQTDHVLQFSALDNFLPRAQLISSPPTTSAQPVFTLPEILRATSREMFSSSVPTDLPPDECEQLLCLRSTLLLI